MCKHKPNASCAGVPSAQQWWQRQPGWFRREELPRVLALPQLYDVRLLPCTGVAHDDARVASACRSMRRVAWWERPTRSVTAELRFQAGRLAGQPAFVND